MEPINNLLDKTHLEYGRNHMRSMDVSLSVHRLVFSTATPVSRKPYVGTCQLLVCLLC